MFRPFQTLAAPLLALVAAGALGCAAPAVLPLRPMTALAGGEAQTEVSGVVGYAPVPNAGLGDANFPGQPYAEGELRLGVARPVQITASLGMTFHRYFFPWPSTAALGARVVWVERPELSLAIAPRLVGASSLSLTAGTGNTVFGTRSLGAELPLLATHRFDNGWSLTGSGWGRAFALRQESLAIEQSGESAVAPVSLGRFLALGGGLTFGFPKLHGSSTTYTVGLGLERSWMVRTGASREELLAEPRLELNRWNLAASLGVTLPL